MRYIAHHRFKELALCGERLNLPYGTELRAADGVIATLDWKAVCNVSSENAQRHFSRDDDGKGLERGALAYALAYGGRDAGGGFRFSKEEAETLARDWGRFLRQDVGAILFNEDFFAAEPEELRELAAALKRSGKRRGEACIRS